ncbi:tetratricopeptide repeat protein [Myxococcota bacterium]|nr:tetratricopeptide repeat protein [Myxococcota bacterium]
MKSIFRDLQMQRADIFQEIVGRGNRRLIIHVLGVASCVLIVSLLATTPAIARQTDKGLSQLFDLLSKESIPPGRSILRIERKIWRLWTDSGRGDVDSLMRKGIRALGQRDYDRALNFFNQIISLDPEFSEGWNKRATVRFLRGEFKESLEDIESTLILEPRHFGALEGRGMIYENLGELRNALEAYERVRLIHPHMRGLKEKIQILRRKTGQRAT